MAGSARLLFVLSNDYGELANAMYLVRGYDFRAVLLMPDRLFAANREDLGVPVYRYGSTREVMDRVATEAPDLVLLFSGYLYTVNDIFPVEDVERLVGELRRGGHRVVTSDPFLGILSALDASTFSERHPRRQWLIDHFGRLARAFADVPHLDLVPLEDARPGAAGSRPRRVSFFNEHLVADGSRLAEHARTVAAAIGADPARKRWLFVLSTEDYGGQIGLLGKPTFDALLLDRLRDTAREGRQPILVAPDVCIAAIGHDAAAVEGAVLLPFCGYRLFTALLHEAEYGFYWNVFSNSIPARIANRLPVFFFDPGHMARAIPPLFEVGMAAYYAGSEVVYLDQRRPLAADALAPLAAKQAWSLEPARVSFRRSPRPDEMVRALVEGPA